MTCYFIRKAFGVALMALCLLGGASALAASLDEQRQWYEEAKEALSDDDVETFRRLREKLDDYPLVPYLDYREFARNLVQKKPSEVEAFIKEFDSLPFSETIRERYLQYLADAERWQNFVFVQPMPPRDEVMRCHYYYAQSKLGNTELAWQGAESLWMTGKSISDACDPLLGKWQKAGQRTNNVILDRMLLVYAEKNRNRLKYLYKQLSKKGQTRGKAVLDLYDNPENVGDFAKRSKVTPFNQNLTIIAYKRLVRSDVREAVKQYDRVMAGQHFPAAKRQRMADYTASALFATDDKELILWRDSKLEGTRSKSLLERRFRLAIRQAKWQEAQNWMERLPENEKTSIRWTFWQAHLLVKAGKKEEADKLYHSILGKRNYYSAAAATILGKPIVYPVKTAQETIDHSHEHAAALLRIKELIALDKLFSAYREWEYLLDRLDNDEVVNLATYAAANKWHHMAVQATISGELWDYIELRFPIAHKWWFDFFSKKRGLSATTMMALARQESALNVEALSPVGARGLMQLMPMTAKETAQKLGRNYQGKKSLFDPGVNIRLGSGYLKMMLERYDDNRIFAFAAYNAGPTRVARWREETDGKLNVYEFIEAIPFAETRRYVENILMFEVYYGDLIGKKTPLLKPNELEAKY
ncbi:Soluble lytic murein transglycosylase precursor [Photobacterium marinum]|uniref:Soluble lytic murein transglycosylase n=1 Tax=Photobacterium marinum TaxID=1056511 RepID=L8JBE5_9GAMM|nr:murein transglycosylase [Photobacterium marinum]ELR66136.1 Soluble lytic murein transglycosylase precursor [Photobacterium marinum]